MKAFLTDENSYYNTKVHVLKFIETDDSGNTIDKSCSALLLKADHSELNDQAGQENVNINEENNEKNDKSMNVSDVEPAPTPKDKSPDGKEGKEEGEEKKQDDPDAEGSVSSCNFQFKFKFF